MQEHKHKEAHCEVKIHIFVRSCISHYEVAITSPQTSHFIRIINADGTCIAQLKFVAQAFSNVTSTCTDIVHHTVFRYIVTSDVCSDTCKEIVKWKLLSNVRIKILSYVTILKRPISWDYKFFTHTGFHDLSNRPALLTNIFVCAPAAILH